MSALPLGCRFVEILIVGAGHAGAQCAIALRAGGFVGTLAIIGREQEPPYERPPLTKEYFSREKSFERLYIRPPDFWKEKRVELILGTQVVSVDADAHVVTMSDGRKLAYGRLVWAAGGDARQLSCEGADLAGVHTLRTRQDCDRLMAEVDGGVRRIVIVGGGYIGLEAAAVLTKLGCQVTLLEAMSRVLARVAGPDLSAFYEAEHIRNGVDLRGDVTVARLLGQERVSGVEMEDGRVIAADAVIVGIGIVPSVQPLITAGAKGGQGVNVDAYCRTSLDDIFAIGDCAVFACSYAGGTMMRVESVQNAHDQGQCVARFLLGHRQAYRALPWFWSNQYDLRLQTAGIALGYDRAVLRGRPQDRCFSVVYLKQDVMIAIDAVNRPKDYVQGRKLIEAEARPDIDRLTDDALALKDLV